MANTVVAVDPLSGRQALLVEIHPELGHVPDETVSPFLQRMFQRNIRVGLIVSPSETLVVRDTLSSMEFASNRFSVDRLQSPLLLEGAKQGAPAQGGERFSQQVVQMLEAIGSSWYSFLHDSAVAAMVPDVVGNLAEASLEVWDGLLEPQDAAE